MCQRNEGVHNKCGGVAGKCEYLINWGRVENKMKKVSGANKWSIKNKFFKL